MRRIYAGMSHAVADCHNIIIFGLIFFRHDNCCFFFCDACAAGIIYRDFERKRISIIGKFFYSPKFTVICPVITFDFDVIFVLKRQNYISEVNVVLFTADAPDNGIILLRTHDVDFGRNCNNHSEIPPFTRYSAALCWYFRKSIIDGSGMVP